MFLFPARPVPKLRLWMIDALWLTALRIRGNADQSRVSPTWDLFNETLENGVYKSLIVLHNYQRGNMTMFPESVQGRISKIEAKLDAQT